MLILFTLSFFKKNNSGKVYRLRTPSPRYLASVSKYDSSNPTKDWGFPDLYADLQSSMCHGSNPIHGSDTANAANRDNLSASVDQVPVTVKNVICCLLSYNENFI